MPLPRVRFTVRRMMVAVAVAGLGLGMEACRRHLVAASASHLWSATSHRFEAQTQDHKIAMSELERQAAALFPGTGTPGVILDDAAIARCRRLMAHHRQLAAKYDRAARYPWLPVAPDPPEPE